MNKLAMSRRKSVVAALLEGTGINATSRLTGVGKHAVLKLLTDLGRACAEFHDKHVRGLKPERVETDEVWSFVGSKQKNVAPEKQGTYGLGDIWLWTAITEKKLILSYHVGLRTQDDANEFMLDLAGRILNRTQLTTDSHLTYEGAVSNAFGFDVDYAQLQKTYAGTQADHRSSEAKYSPPRINGSRKRPIIGLPDRAWISTSGIERHNLTIRQQNKRYARLTLGHSKKVANHEASVHLFMVYYNYCRKHLTLKTTPAVASGLADHVWTLDELIGLLG